MCKMRKLSFLINTSAIFKTLLGLCERGKYLFNFPSPERRKEGAGEEPVKESFSHTLEKIILFFCNLQIFLKWRQTHMLTVLTRATEDEGYGFHGSWQL